jgi:lipopolysaccharide export system protein LptA
MKRNSMIVCVMAGFFFVGAVSAPLAFAKEKKNVEEKQKSEEKNNVKEPIVITSQSMTTDQKAKTALFEGNVVAKKGDRTMYADKMLVYYSDEKGSSNVKKIEAGGNVKLVRGDRIVISKFATYFSEPEEYTVFTGEPRASEGDNVITGTKITYFMADDHSIVENSKVFIVNKEKTGTRR